MFSACECAGIYLTLTMGMTSLSIILTVFVLQLHHVSPRQRPAPHWLHCLMIRYVAPALCMRTHVTDYYACERPSTCNAVALRNRRPSERDVCLVGAFGADFNGLQVSDRLFTVFIKLIHCLWLRGIFLSGSAEPGFGGVRLALFYTAQISDS